MLSVNTNPSAMTALQYLNQTQAQLAQTQTAINTGLRRVRVKELFIPARLLRNGDLGMPIVRSVA